MANPPVSPLECRVSKAAEVMKITEEAVYQALSELGVDKEDEDAISLLEADTTREADAKEAFKSTKVKPARFSAGWQVLKGRVKKENIILEDNSSLLEALKPVGRMSDKELLEKYGPESSSEIIDELLKRSNGRPFVIYKSDNETIDLERTLEHLRIARRRETSPVCIVDGEEVRVYTVNQFPMTYVEECPFHAGTILTNGYCDKCHNTWEGISDEVRVAANVALVRGMVSTGNLMDIATLIVRLRQHGIDELKKVPSFSRIYSEMQEDGTLPKLRKRISVSRNGKLDPLNQHKRY